MTVFDLDRYNRLLIARAFGNHRRVNLTIPSIIEGQHGFVFVDTQIHPNVFQIQQGPFTIFAGSTRNESAKVIVKYLFPGCHILSPSDDWVELLTLVYGQRLEKYQRFSFSSNNLNRKKLLELLESYKQRMQVRRIDEHLGEKINNDPKHRFHFMNFSSIHDFLQRGIGYCAIENDIVIGVASSAIVCSQGIEVNIMVLEEYRKRGVATVLASSLLQYCIEHGIDPHWDAQNELSCGLATKLGYIQEGSYDTYRLKSTQGNK